MTNFRVEIAHWTTGALPADRWVNVLYVSAPSTVSAATIGPQLQTAFFNNSGFNLYDNYFGSVTMYDMAAPTPRPEVFFSSYTPASPADPTGINPAQVALCLSFFAERNLPHTRGRLYIGPFYDMTPFLEVPTTALIGQLIGLATELGTATDYTHDVYSPKESLFSPVTNYWVDNRWDTQRRRLSKATTRTNYQP